MWKRDDVGHRQRWRAFQVREWLSKDTEGGENLGCLGNSLGKECRGRGWRGGGWKSWSWGSCKGHIMKRSDVARDIHGILFLSFLCPLLPPLLLFLLPLYCIGTIYANGDSKTEGTILEMFKSPWGCWEDRSWSSESHLGHWWSLGLSWDDDMARFKGEVSVVTRARSVS